jgi:glycosyltransferase involved in cell wall biosynthesis
MSSAEVADVCWNDAPVISVIIPTLDEEATIGACLRSLDNQTLDRDAFEIIVVDGDSTDNTCNIARKYADEIMKQTRAGIGGARKDGAEIAQGRVLVFTDADSCFAPEWLQAIANNLLVQGYDASTGPIRFSERTVQSEVIRLWRMQYNLLHLFNFYRIIGPNMAITRSVYDRIRGHSAISILEDFDLSLRLFREGNIRCNYDPTQIVYTSSRRMRNLFGYMLVMLYGHYHLHITHDYQRLLRYPKFNEMGAKYMLEWLANIGVEESKD